MLESYLLLFVSILTFILGVPANILAFHTFYIKLHNEPTPMDMLLLNLSFTNLIFLAFLPLKMKEAADNMEWNLPYFLCPVSTIVFFSSIYTITLLLTAVSVERCLAVVFPIRYKLWRKPRYAMMASVLLWLVAGINMSITYSLHSVQSDNVNSTVTPGVKNPPRCCDYQYDQRTFVHIVRLELSVVLFLIPFLICCFCYTNFIRITLLRFGVAHKFGRRAVGQVVVTLLLFLCFAPYNISHVVEYVHDRSEGWRGPALISATLTVCLNPMMFYFSSAMREAVRRYLQVLMEKLCIKHHPPMFPEPS